MNWTHNIKITNEDNMALMARYPDDHFDLAIVDPPYGININHSIGRRKGDKKSELKPAYWDSNSPKKEYFEELFRVSKNQIIWGANYFISKMPLDSSCWLMWEKKFSELVTFAQFELAWTSFNTTCKKFAKFPDQNGRIHPTQKPVALYKWILQNYAKEGDLILDTHLGSGSIAIACHQMGFDLVGCELDADYYKSAHKRFKQQTAQMRLAI
jgi:site-specific DNA-methyltransferase (adenine-specific)